MQRNKKEKKKTNIRTRLLKLTATAMVLLLTSIFFYLLCQDDDRDVDGEISEAETAEDKDMSWMQGTFIVGGRRYTSDPSGWIRTKDFWISPRGEWGKEKASDSTLRGWNTEDRFRYYIKEDGSYGSCVIIWDDRAPESVNAETENALPLNTDFLSFWRYGASGIGWISKDGEQFPVGKDEKLLKEKLVYDLTGRLFWLDDTGRPAGGLVNWNGKTFYFLENGTLCREAQWIDSAGRKYYVNENGEILKGQFLRVDGARYYLDGEGSPVKGFRMVENKLRYFDPEGRMQEKAGWILIDGKYYYMNQSLELVKDRVQEINGKRYCFDGDGVMLTGRIQADKENFYYTDDKGAILTDQDFELDGFTYHADAEGKVFVGTMFEKAQGYYSDTGYLILCNLATQRTAVFEGAKGNWKLMREMIVSTGAPINPTPKGEYKTTVHTEHFNSYGVRAWYATGFIGGLYLFHSSPYEIASKPLVCTDDRLGEPHSHGCVRMALEDAKWMYDNLPLRTKVVIYEEK